MAEILDNITVIIPAYKPDGKLINTIEGIFEAGLKDIIIVDDGSGEAYKEIFDQVKTLPGCTLLIHKKNCGKGAALKTAFEYYLKNRVGFAGIVTADADGQHLPSDIRKCASEMKKSGSVVLGSRDFSDSFVPLRSRQGNRITSFVLRLFFGLRINDTQTGLRAVPDRYVEKIAEASGDRYEYETNMLFMMKKHKIPYEETKIETVYIDENRSSHFRPVRDSLRIYSLILKYVLSSAISSLTDNILYYLFLKLCIDNLDEFTAMIISYVLARGISSIVNYIINVKVVFEDNSDKGTVLRYYALAVPLMIVSAVSVYLVKHFLGISMPILCLLIKIAVDTVLFFASFRIQHRWVFKDAKQ